jgi:hypothetical protein
VIDKTIRGLAGVIRQTLASEEIAARSGLLQHLDARAKLVGVPAPACDRRAVPRSVPRDVTMP